MMNLRTAFSLLACLVLPLPSSAGTSYRFSPVNQWDIPKTAAYWNPIIKYVSEKSGVNLELKIGRTSADTTAYVLAGEVDFVFTNHLFSPEREKLGWRVFARRWTPPIHSQIVTLGRIGRSPAWSSLSGRKWCFRGRSVCGLSGQLWPIC
jgi:phosphonate transport system substrate-binding protein